MCHCATWVYTCGHKILSRVFCVIRNPYICSGDDLVNQIHPRYRPCPLCEQAEDLKEFQRIIEAQQRREDERQRREDEHCRLKEELRRKFEEEEWKLREEEEKQRRKEKGPIMVRMSVRVLRSRSRQEQLDREGIFFKVEEGELLVKGEKVEDEEEEDVKVKMEQGDEDGIMGGFEEEGVKEEDVTMEEGEDNEGAVRKVVKVKREEEEEGEGEVFDSDEIDEMDMGE